MAGLGYNVMIYWRYLHPALGPGAVLPPVAGSDRTGLPLLHLRRAGPAVALRGLNHRPLTPHLTWRKETGSDIISVFCLFFHLKISVLHTMCRGFVMPWLNCWIVCNCLIKQSSIITAQARKTTANPSLTNPQSQNRNSCLVLDRCWIFSDLYFFLK